MQYNNKGENDQHNISDFDVNKSVSSRLFMTNKMHDKKFLSESYIASPCRGKITKTESYRKWRVLELRLHEFLKCSVKYLTFVSKKSNYQIHFFYFSWKRWKKQELCK